MKRLRLCDAHTHLQDEWLKAERPQIAAALDSEGVFASVVNGTSEADWSDVLTLACEYAFVRPSLGLHPWDVGNAGPRWRDTLQQTLNANPRIAVGEIGLDRWILDRARPDDPRLIGLRRAPLAEQIDALRWQLGVAATLERPVTLHCLDATGPLLEVLRTSPRIARGFLLHAYSGPGELVPTFAALGAYFSFNGAFLASRYQARRDVFRIIPADRLLAETDAPAMPLPAERRRYTLPDTAEGFTRNHPANLAEVYAGLAELRGEPVDSLAVTIERNFERLFGH